MTSKRTTQTVEQFAEEDDTRDEVLYPAWMERDPDTGEVPE